MYFLHWDLFIVLIKIGMLSMGVMRSRRIVDHWSLNFNSWSFIFHPDPGRRDARPVGPRAAPEWGWSGYLFENFNFLEEIWLFGGSSHLYEKDHLIIGYFNIFSHSSRTEHEKWTNWISYLSSIAKKNRVFVHELFIIALELKTRKRIKLARSDFPTHRLARSSFTN